MVKPRDELGKGISESGLSSATDGKFPASMGSEIVGGREVPSHEHQPLPPSEVAFPDCMSMRIG